MVDINLASLGIELGGGALIGLLIGFAAKKIAKLIAVLIGLELALFKFLESRGILSVDWEQLTAGMVDAGSSASSSSPPSWINTILSTFAVSAGFASGFFLGFKKA